MKAFATCLGILSLTYSALSCAWITQTKYNGERVRVSDMPPFIDEAFSPDATRMERDLRGSTNFNERSDYAVALMYLNRSKEAVTLLDKLEKEKPGEYFIAANLGTAYELSGNNQEALRWIGEGIRRNTDSHFGTEWLHVRVCHALWSSGVLRMN